MPANVSLPRRILVSIRQARYIAIATCGWKGQEEKKGQIGLSKKQTLFLFFLNTQGVKEHEGTKENHGEQQSFFLQVEKTVDIKEIDGKWGDFGRRGRHVQREEGIVGWGSLAMSQFIVGNDQYECDL